MDSHNFMCSLSLPFQMAGHHSWLASAEDARLTVWH
jgi:hypothetical protein